MVLYGMISTVCGATDLIGWPMTPVRGGKVVAWWHGALCSPIALCKWC